jgi:hypothetical protein
VRHLTVGCPGDVGEDRQVVSPYISLNKYVAGTRHEVWRDYLPVFTDIAGAANREMSH